MLAPKAKADKVLFPKLFQGEFGAEISTLLTSKSQALHSSFWDGDQESFIIQSGARGLAKRMPYVGTTVESAIWRAARQDAGRHDRRRARPAWPACAGQRAEQVVPCRSTWTATARRRPIRPTRWRIAVLGLKVAWEKAAAAKGGAKPTTDEVVTAFKGIEYDSPSGA